MFVAAGGCSGRAPRDSARSLTRDAVVEEALGGTAPHRFAIAVTAGEYVELEVEQLGVDATIDVRDPHGKAIVAAQDFANGTAFSERCGFVARDGGAHVITISASKGKSAPGRFRLTLRGPRAAGPTQQRRAAAFAVEDQLASLVGWRPGHEDEATAETLGRVVEQCEALRREWVALGDRRGEGEALEMCATATRQLSRADEAEAFSDRALAIYHELGWKAGEAHGYLERGSARYIHGAVNDAREQWSRAKDLALAAGDASAAATAQTGLGITSISIEDYRRARDEMKTAKELAVASDDSDAIALVEDNLGRVYARLGDGELAIEHYTRALAMHESSGDAREAGRTRHAIAVVERDLQDNPSAARADLTRALELSRRTGNRDGEALALTDLGLTDRAAGDLASAAKRLDEAVAIARDLGAAFLIARARGAQGLIALDRGAADDALAAYREARSAYAQTAALGAEALAIVGQARAHVARNELDEARRDVSTALSMLESVRARAPSPELRASYFASVRSAYDLDIDLRMQLDAGRNGPEAVAAFEASERARSRTLLEVIQTSGGDAAAVAPEERAALDREAAEVARLEAAHQTLLAHSPTSAQVQTSERAITAALARQREAFDALRARNPRAAELIAPRSLTLASAQALVDADSVLLEYIVAEPRSYVFAVGPRTFVARALPGRGEIETAARALHDQLTARNDVVAGESPRDRAARIARADAGVPTAAARLAQLVLEPVSAQLAGKARILVAPDGALAYVPFAVLPPRAGAPGYLLDDQDVVVLPSASVLAALRKRPRRTGPPRIAVIADPVYRQGERPRLPFAADEAAAIASLVPAARLHLATGKEARRDLFTSGAMRGYDIIHVAAHGLVNARYPDLSGLVLSTVDDRGAEQDGFLRLHELYQLDLDAELVTLSGCETALGREIRGEGMIGLARGFLHAGARRVVASLWQVHDRATAELMRRFYQAMLDRGLSPPAALREARRELRDQTSYKAPYFWAAFVLQGDDAS